MVKQFLLAWIAFCLVGCSQSDSVDRIDDADITVIATELSADAWRIEFHFPASQSALIFARSKGDYRRTSWVPIDDAPDVQRIGGFDALIFDTPRASFAYEISPQTEKLPQDYTPFLGFSDGGRAVFTGQFELLAVADRAAIEALAGDLTQWQGEQPRLGVRIVTDRPMLVQGKRVTGSVEHTDVGGGTYVYVGESELYQGESYIGVIDKGLPDHVRANLDDDLSALFEIYDARWGFSLPSRATLYYAFEGYTHPGYSNSGSVLGTDLMVLQSSGEALRDPDPENRVRNLWFFAHEGAHMYQSHLMRRFTVGPHAWIHEGGANAIANSAIQSLPGVPDDFIISEYRSAFDQCVADLERGSLVTAHVDGRFYAHYHCGQLFNAAADAALVDHDLYAFWATFTRRLDAVANDPDQAFYASLLELGADPEVGDMIEALASTPRDDPRADLTRLLVISGLAPEFDENGALISLNVPK
ncbi:MAG: hypothetical protein AAF437_15320 [Pseudomonadota bacterium]